MHRGLTSPAHLIGSDGDGPRCCWGNGEPHLRKGAGVKQLVSAEMIEQTLESFNSASPEEKTALRLGTGSFQEELTAFAVVYSENLPDHERALVLALLAAVVDAFRRSGATFRKVRRAEILHAWKTNAAFVRDLRAGGDGRGNAEPEVLLLVLDLLLETEP